MSDLLLLNYYVVVSLLALRIDRCDIFYVLEKFQRKDWQTHCGQRWSVQIMVCLRNGR